MNFVEKNSYKSFMRVKDVALPYAFFKKFYFIYESAMK